jgi:hypothetical protein
VIQLGDLYELRVVSFSEYIETELLFYIYIYFQKGTLYLVNVGSVISCAVIWGGGGAVDILVRAKMGLINQFYILL